MSAGSTPHLNNRIYGTVVELQGRSTPMEWRTAGRHRPLAGCRHVTGAARRRRLSLSVTLPVPLNIRIWGRNSAACNPREPKDAFKASRRCLPSIAQQAIRSCRPCIFDNRTTPHTGWVGHLRICCRPSHLMKGIDYESGMG